MLIVTNQCQTETRRIYYYHLEENKWYGCYFMVGFDRDTSEVVYLAAYSDYKQAINVFAEMRYLDNDLIYYRQHDPYYIMPENMINGQAIPVTSIYFDLIVPRENAKGFKYLMGKHNYVDNGCVMINNGTYIEGTCVMLPEETEVVFNGIC